MFEAPTSLGDSSLGKEGRSRESGGIDKAREKEREGERKRETCLFAFLGKVGRPTTRRWKVSVHSRRCCCYVTMLRVIGQNGIVAYRESGKVIAILRSLAVRGTR